MSVHALRVAIESLVVHNAYMPMMVLPHTNLIAHILSAGERSGFPVAGECSAAGHEGEKVWQDCAGVFCGRWSQSVPRSDIHCACSLFGPLRLKHDEVVFEGSCRQSVYKAVY